VKLLTVMTAEQQWPRKVGYDKHLSLINEGFFIRSDLFAYVLPRRLVKLGLATPLSTGLDPVDRWLCVLIFR
jgi:hypothetical protein